ncbi:chromate resistance protein ChrB domain-containing protein [Microbulbifer sp. TYP-18]|uniref:chromate resistance protein ChrB domain-containing protein n=1 Tax=Microbulbifer sp. TYP-18 TaxID=3230024 RepID=UPI0034C6CFB9
MRIVLIATCLFLGFTACSKVELGPPQAFVTEYGLGPDKWATAWLLTRHVNPKAALVVVDQGAALPVGTPFDTPEAELRRIDARTAFEVTQTTYAIEDPGVLHLVGVIRDIEVNFWGADRTPEAQIVESAFRSLQERYGRDAVAGECYLKFFDQVHAALAQSPNPQTPLTPASLAVNCDNEPSAPASSAVQELSIADLLVAMKQGKRVAFVDVREEEEFTEAHIPDALNLPLRHLNQEAISALKQADYVVSYCVKDFRGFEMAKALKLAGVEQSVILKPYGIKGWVTQGLPTVGSRALGREEAIERLNQCVSLGRCPVWNTPAQSPAQKG